MAEFIDWENKENNKPSGPTDSCLSINEHNAYNLGDTSSGLKMDKVVDPFTGQTVSTGALLDRLASFGYIGTESEESEE